MSCPLLHTPTACGYPVEYLVARIRSRRREGALRRLLPLEEAATLPSYDDLEIEQVAFAERRWLYRQMDVITRTRLFPVFVHSELCRLFTLLRLFAGDHEAGNVLCGETLLHADIITHYRTMDSPHTFIAFVNDLLIPLFGHDCRLALCYGQTGLAHAEEVMVENLLSWGARDADQALVRTYFGHLIDRYNQGKLLKWQRWQLTAPCTFVAGGRQQCARLNRIVKSGQPSTSPLAVDTESGSAPPLAFAPPDPLRAMLTARARQQDGLAEILLYLTHIDAQQVELRQGPWRRPSLSPATHQVRA